MINVSHTCSSAEKLTRHIQPVYPPSEVSKLWGAVGPMLLPALDIEGTLAEVYANLMSQRAQLWLGWDDGQIEFALVTEVRHYPTQQIAYLCLAAGKNAQQWLSEGLGEIEAWARAVGCDMMRLHGRKGWKKLAPDYKQKTVILEKML